jgi:hypothetical protein
VTGGSHVAETDDSHIGRRLILKWGLYAGIVGLLVLSVVFDKADKHEMHKTLDLKIASAIGVFFTLGLYSFLFGENSVYRFIEHLMVGLIAGIVFVQGLQQGLYTYWVIPLGAGLKSMTGAVWAWGNLWPLIAVLLGLLSFVVFRKRPWLACLLAAVCIGVGVVLLECSRWGTGRRWSAKLLWIFALIPGSLWYTMYSKRHLWLSRLISVFVIGAGIGMGLKAAFSNLVDQAAGTFKPLWDQTLVTDFSWQGLTALVGNYLFVIVTLMVLFYFVFTLRVSDHPLAQRSQRLSRLFMMVSFGIVFGTVVGTRMGLVVDRIYFLVEEWAKPIIYSWF